jgi:hypothetical protein
VALTCCCCLQQQCGGGQRQQEVKINENINTRKSDTYRPQSVEGISKNDRIYDDSV